MPEDIMHKELLAFSNLTNLEWEFVDLKEISNSEEDRRTTQLNDLLTPEVFERIIRVENEEDDIYEEKRKYIYGGEGYEEYDEEKGLAEMRKEAGIAMEYLEKEEGEFLKDWEVIYAGDKYKILADYLDEREEILHDLVEEYTDEDELEGSLYPSREEIEEELEARLRIQYGAKLAGKGLTIVSSFAAKPMDLNSLAGGDSLLSIGEKLGEDIVTNAFKDEVKDLSPRLHLLMTVLGNPTAIDKLTGGVDPGALAEELQGDMEESEKFELLEKDKLKASIEL